MDLTPLLASGTAIQLHVAAALLATVLGGVVFALEKGTRLHKGLGRLWVGAMAVTALSSFFITEIRMVGPYSVLHALSVLTLGFLVTGIYLARTGRIASHRQTMASTYVLALILTGGFTLLPGRRLHAVVFSDGGVMAGLSALLVLALLGGLVLARRRRMAGPEVEKDGM